METSLQVFSIQFSDLFISEVNDLNKMVLMCIFVCETNCLWLMLFSVVLQFNINLEVYVCVFIYIYIYIYINW